MLLKDSIYIKVQGKELEKPVDWTQIKHKSMAADIKKFLKLKPVNFSKNYPIATTENKKQTGLQVKNKV